MYIKKNILTVNNGIICHQVNCKGKMGAGIALKIRKKWPVVYEQYLSECLTGKIQLGSVQMVKISPLLCVANLAAQDGYGKNKRYTNYVALMSCFFDLQKISDNMKLQIYIPYKIGCSNAGGDWEMPVIYFRLEFTHDYFHGNHGEFENKPEFIWDLKKESYGGLYDCYIIIPPVEASNKLVKGETDSGKYDWFAYQNNGLSKEDEKEASITDADKKNCWKWLEELLSKLVEDRHEMLD